MAFGGDFVAGVDPGFGGEDATVLRGGGRLDGAGTWDRRDTVSTTITVKARRQEKRRLARAAKRAGKSLSAYLLEAATERLARPTSRPDYSRLARELHGESYLAVRLADALER